MDVLVDPLPCVPVPPHDGGGGWGAAKFGGAVDVVALAPLVVADTPPIANRIRLAWVDVNVDGTAVDAGGHEGGGASALEVDVLNIGTLTAAVGNALPEAEGKLAAAVPVAEVKTLVETMVDGITTLGERLPERL